MTNIVNLNIKTPPSYYEAYLYSYTNLETNQKYIGYHTGSVDDNYKHSSTNEEFQKVFCDSKSKLQYDVLFYGGTKEMKTMENTLLEKVDAKNNPEYYNKHNGYPVYIMPDLDKCQALINQIEDGTYPINMEPIELHVNMDYLQPRFQNDHHHQIEITQKIDDENGNTDKCNPVIVYEGRGKDNGDIRGDGSHTVNGAAKSKHAKQIPVIRIPFELLKDFTDAELKAIGNLLNKRPEVIKKPVQPEDGVKHVLDQYEQGIPYNSNNNVEWLKAYGFSGGLSKGQIKTILKNAKSIIDKNELQKNNKLFIDYKAQPHHKELLNTVAGYGQNPDICSIYMSSAKFSTDRIIETLWAMRPKTKDEAGGNNFSGKKTIMVVIHHPTLEAEKSWKQKAQPNWMRMFDYFLKDGLQVRFHEMETTMSDGSVS